LENRKLVKRGAEANLYSTEWFGRPAISKVRIKKSYRRKELDDWIRSHRTLREARLMSKARSNGVSTPIIFFVDPLHGEIIMEEILGRRLKEVMENINNTELKRTFSGVGSMIGRLHEDGIIHGDLTTSNMIICDGTVYRIDFGLSIQSQRLEDKGMDLRLLKGVLSSAHSRVFNQAYKFFIAGYRTSTGSKATEHVLQVVEQIERRGRYARVD